MNRKRLGQYELVGQLGAGGMGAVFRARDAKLNRDVAIKVLLQGALVDDITRKSFRREAETLARLNHPHIAAVYDFGQDDEIDFLVMEYVPGVTLADLIVDRGALSEHEVFRIGEQVALALQEAHEQGVVHHDLKPGNIMVTPKGTVKVLDFGVAQLMPGESTGEAEEIETQLFQVAGTLAYMSPEQLRRDPIDGRSDIYSLGTVLYEMAAGQRPHSQTSLPELSQAILHEAPPPPSSAKSDVSAPLDAIVMKAVAKDVDSRYQSAGDLADDLSALRLGTTAPHSLTAAATPAKARPRLFAGLLGVAAAAALALVAWSVWPTGSAAPNGTVSSLVVLPAAVAGGPEDDFLADAIPSSLSTQLARSAALDTKIPPSRVEFDNISGDLGRVARAYQVGAFVLPAVAVQEQQLVLTLQLVDAESRSLLWADDFAGERAGYLELARQAAQGLLGHLQPEAETLAPAQQAGSSAGELALRQGLYLSSLYAARGLPEHFAGAREALERALQLDRERHEAASAIGRLYAAQVVTGVEAAELLEPMRDWARRAIDINPRSSTAWAVLSEAEQIDPAGDWGDMLDYALSAATYGPRDAYAQSRLAYALSRRSFLLSLEASRTAAQLDPLELMGPLAEAISLGVLGRRAEARARVERVLAIEPDMAYAVLVGGLVDILEGDGESAGSVLAELESAVDEGRLRPEWFMTVSDYVALERHLRTGGGDPADEAASARLMALARGQFPFPRWEGASAQVAPLLSRFGQTDAALELIEQRAELGVVENLEFLVLTPDFESMRDEPRFRAIIDKSLPRFEDMLARLLAARERGQLPPYLELPMDEVELLVRGGLQDL